MEEEDNKSTFKDKIKSFFTNKWFWITFGVIALGLITYWCIVAPKADSKTALNITPVVALFIGLFVIIILGELLGSITIKGVSFGTAGVFIVALGIGVGFSLIPKDVPFLGQFVLNEEDVRTYGDILENLGLILFVSAVGFIAGPTFFRGFKSNAKCYITMGIIVTLIGILITAGIAQIPGFGADYASGLFSGAITSTPALAAAQEVAGDSTMVTIGYAITYPFGVLGVVLFIQLMPKILKANIDEEQKKILIKNDKNKEEHVENKREIFLQNLFKFDKYGFTPMAIGILFGLLIGAITIPLTPQGFNGPCFSLGTTGGCLLSTLLLGHFGHFGKLSLEVSSEVNNTFREFGLILFLAGVGVVGGYNLVTRIQTPGSNINGSIIGIGIAFGVLITIIPMAVGYILGKYWFKLPLFNNLGSLTGSMTSTPALGALINTAKTDEVAIAYASAFPIATVLTAIATNLLIVLSK